MKDIQNNQYDDDDTDTEEPEPSSNGKQQSTELNNSNKSSLRQLPNEGKTSSSSPNATDISSTTARTSTNNIISQINIGDQIPRNKFIAQTKCAKHRLINSHIALPHVKHLNIKHDPPQAHLLIQPSKFR